MSSLAIGTKRIIGIDGGGTKTACVIGDEHGRLLAVCYGGSGNVKSRAREEVEQMLLDLIDQALRLSGSDRSQLAAVTLGLAGSSRENDRRRMLDFLQPHLPGVQVTLHTDAITALATGAWGEAGIVLIAGTGSIGYGFLAETGETVRVGGWGYLLGDEGSGYDLGRKALIAVLKQFDGRGEATMLTQTVLDRLKLTGPDQFIEVIYENPQARKDIADLAILVVQAAKQGDQVALNIVDEAVQELAEIVHAANNKLHKQARKLVLAGGLFGDDLFLSRFEIACQEDLQNLQLVRTNLPPVIGAYNLGLTGLGVSLDEGTKQIISQSWAEIAR